MPIALTDCTVLGGSGHPVVVGKIVNRRFSEVQVELEHPDRGVRDKIHYAEILELLIGGPGAVTTGGSFIGGGFGVAGALEGIAVATVLNLLTTRTRLFTIMQFSTHRGEVFLHYGALEPGALRITLSSVLTRLRFFDPSWTEKKLQRLETLRAKEILSEEHLRRLMAELLSPGSPQTLASPDPYSPAHY